MWLKRLSTSFQTTIESISAQLYPDEAILLAQDGVGLYDGKDKSPAHVDGRLYLTSHRILYVDTLKPHRSSLYLPLSSIKQTEYWAGFLKSSAKITLLFAPASDSSSLSQESASPTTQQDSTPSDANTAAEGNRTWVCRVCGMQNVPSAKCSLCGVPRDTATVATPTSRNPSRPSTPTPLSNLRSTPSAPPIPPRPPPPLPPPSSPATTVPTSEKDKRLACPTCTFLNHPSMSKCELCDSSLSNSLPIATLTALTLAATIGRSDSPAPFEGGVGTGSGGQPFVRLSFRKGGDKAFYTSLKGALEAKKWDFSVAKSGSGDGEKRRGGGIDAIMKNMDEESKSRGDELDDAFKDLDKLMKNAKEMIILAQTLNERLSAAEAASPSAATSPTASQKTLVRTSLQSLGLEAAVTPDMVKESEKYHEELAKELFAILWGKNKTGATGSGGGIMSKEGIVGLDEVWCVWNRARGVALVSPTDLKLAAPFLSKLSPPIYLRSFRTGLTVLHTSHYTLSTFARRFVSLLDLRQALFASSDLTIMEREEKDGATTLEVAREEGLAVGLSREMCEEVEMNGLVVRDEQAEEGVRWFRNYILPVT